LNFEFAVPRRRWCEYEELTAVTETTKGNALPVVKVMLGFSMGLVYERVTNNS